MSWPRGVVHAGDVQGGGVHAGATAAAVPQDLPAGEGALHPGPHASVTGPARAAVGGEGTSGLGHGVAQLLAAAGSSGSSMRRS